jgi:tetratricopeptide (TPR) repeat protein
VKPAHSHLIVAAVAASLLAAPAQTFAQERTGIQTPAEQALADANAAFEQGKVQEAETSFRKAISLDPMLVEAYERYSILLFGTKRYKEGERLAREGLAKVPGSGSLKAQLGLHLFRLGQNAKAYEQLKDSVADIRDRFEVQYVAGLCFIKRGDYQRAKEALDAYLTNRPARLAPSDPSTQAMLGTALVKLKELDRATQVLRGVLQVQPKNVPARIAQAELFLRRTDFSRATSAFEELRREKITIDSLLLAQAYFGARRYDGAIREADAYLRDHPTSHAAILLRGDAALAINNTDRALADFQRAAALAGRTVEIKQRIVEVWLRKGRNKEALAEVAPLAERPDATPLTLQLAVRASIRARQLTDTVTYATRLAERAGANADHLYFAGMGLSAAGKYTEAIPVLEKAVKLNPRHDGARRELIRSECNLARKEFSKAEYATAVGHLKKALAQDPQSLVVNRDLALIYLAEDKPKAALTHLELILRRVPGDFIGNRLAGRAHLMLGNGKKAATYFEKATGSVLKLGGLALARALAEAATVHIRLGSVDQAILELTQALRLVQLEGAPELLVAVRGNLARAHFVRAQGLTLSDEKRAWTEMQRSLALAEVLPAEERAALQLAGALTALSVGQVEMGKKLLDVARSKAATVMQPPYDKLAAPFLDAYLAYASPGTASKLQAARSFEKLGARVPAKVREHLLALARSAYMQAAVQLFKGHKRREAKAALSKAMRMGKVASIEERHNLAVLDYFSGNKTEAVAALKGLSTKVGMALCNLAVDRDQNGAAQEAYQLFRQCERRGAAFPGLHAMVEAKRRVFGEVE